MIIIFESLHKIWTHLERSMQKSTEKDKTSDENTNDWCKAPVFGMQDEHIQIWWWGKKEREDLIAIEERERKGNGAKWKLMVLFCWEERGCSGNGRRLILHWFSLFHWLGWRPISIVSHEHREKQRCSSYRFQQLVYLNRWPRSNQSPFYLYFTYAMRFACVDVCNVQ